MALDESNRLQLTGLLRGPWIEGVEHDKRASLRWKSVVTLHRLSDPWPEQDSVLAIPLNLGISSNGWWTKWWERSDPPGFGAVECTPHYHCYPLLPLLEAKPMELHRRILEGLEALSLSSKWLDVIPWFRIVETGLKTDSPHWLALALRWTSEFPRTEYLQELIVAGQRKLAEIENEDVSAWEQLWEEDDEHCAH